MTTSARAVGSFPSPFEISTPPGCEGWEEMYPHYALFAEERREPDEARLWFWNSMHFPVPMPAFDITSTDGPYYALGELAEPRVRRPAGDGHRLPRRQLLHLHLGQPASPTRRRSPSGPSTSRSARATTSRTGTTLYAKWQHEDGGAPRRAQALEVPDLPEYEPEEVVFGDEDTRFYKVLDALLARAALCGADVAAPLRVPAARLRRVPDVLRLLQGGAARHPRPAHRADGRRHRRDHVPPGRGAAAARAAGGRHGRRLGVRRRAPAGGDRRGAREERRGPGVARGAREGQGPVVQHGHGRRPVPLLPQLVRRPEHPVRVDRRAHLARCRRARHRAPDRGARGASATASPRATRELLADEQRGPVPGAARAVAHGVPVRRGAQVLLRLLVPDRAGTTRSASSARCSPSTTTSRTPRTSSSSRATR